MHHVPAKQIPSLTNQHIRHPIRDFMTPAPSSIGRKQSLAKALERMRARGLRHLPVLEGGKVAGILSQRDALFVETIAGVDPGLVAVEEAMTPDVYTVSPETPLLEVAAAMAKQKYGCAIVVQGVQIVGIFTAIDALLALAVFAGASEAKG